MSWSRWAYPALLRWLKSPPIGVSSEHPWLVNLVVEQEMPPVLRILFYTFLRIKEFVLISHPLSLVLARRLIKGKMWNRAIRGRTDVTHLVKVESGSVWGSGVCVDGEVMHLVLIIHAIAEPRRSMPGIRGYAGVVGHQRKGACHRAGIPGIPGFIDRDVEDAVDGLCECARYEAGRRWSDVHCHRGVLKMHRAGLRAISIGYRCAG
jgi:hypothetical protein